MHAGVLIAAARGIVIIPVRAHAILVEAERTFVTSDYIRMEVLPKALYHRQSQEVLLYERFFARAIQIVPPSVSLSRGIERVGRKGQVRGSGFICYRVLAIQKEIRADFEPITEHFQMSSREGTLPLQQFRSHTAMNSQQAG